MKKLVLIVGLSLAAAGCAGELTGTEVGGVVRRAAPDDALLLANDHCAKYGKAARISGFTGTGIAAMSTFDCVAK